MYVYTLLHYILVLLLHPPTADDSVRDDDEVPTGSKSGLGVCHRGHPAEHCQPSAGFAVDLRGRYGHHVSVYR